MPRESARTLRAGAVEAGDDVGGQVAFRDLPLGHDLAEGLGLHRQPGQLLADVVMQVLSDAALLGVGDRQELLLQRFSLGDVVHDACERWREPSCSSLKARSMGNVDPSLRRPITSRPSVWTRASVVPGKRARPSRSAVEVSRGMSMSMFWPIMAPAG